MRTLKIQVILILLLIAGGMAINGCQKKHKVELASIDSLLAKNKRTMEYLKIDLITINERKIELTAQIAVLDKFKPDTAGMDFSMNLIKYKAILKIYTRFIENYDRIFNIVRENEKQLSTLKNSVIDEKITGSDFKLALAKEKLNVEQNLINAQTFGNKINNLEPDYQRLSAYFDPQVEALLKQYPELKAEYESAK